ncbi:MAG: efflux RND transporter periplasmic adaptor subunit [Thiolinea sp.]
MYSGTGQLAVVHRRARMTVDGIPDQQWEGRVDYIYPELNAKTRTVQVRLV